ncbi:MAG: hydantoinase/oxoprolinase family protein [SAR324 cluster bacterium]|nr:hydantoinase/oxoprolinase family protein [SAR324 cluster bacterium]
MTTFRLGIDIGGTFTDGALVDEATGELSIIKVPTTPGNPADGFMEAVGRAQRDASIDPSSFSLLVHATTIATNALITGTFGRVGLITTEGFRDVLEIGYQIRPRLYDIFQSKPTPLVSRRWSYGIPERLDARGQVLKPLDEHALRIAIGEMKAGGIEAVVICFLHSYINPVHEQRAAEIVREVFPDAYLSVSSEVCPEFREFPRASTAAVNAAVMPIVSRYVDDLQSRLTRLGSHAPFYIMQSTGGVMNADAARGKPVYMVESGPAAGVIAASALAQAQGHRNVISFDMGGTTAKVGLVIDGQPTLSTEYEVGSQTITPMGEGKGSGYPVRTQVIDLVEVGAGGGSLAWIDAGGSLRVGPSSAGAVPGPVCYGQGGAQPTLTDTNLVLGRLDPDFFLGGELKLDAAAARAALQEQIAQPLGMELLDCADGVLEIANANMMAAMRLISVQRGYDPREFVLVAFGGVGPLHANALADALGLPTVLIPPAPGVASAVGLLMTDIKHEFVATRRVLLAEVSPQELSATFADFEQRASALLATERKDWLSISLVRHLELRYRGQSHELQVVLPAGALTDAELQRAHDQFEEAHKRAYGYIAPEDPVELVNLRFTAIGKLPELARKKFEQGSGDPSQAVKGTRQLWFRGKGEEIECVVYDRYRLRGGDTLQGPALVEEMDSNTVILPGYGARVDEHGNLVISRA